MTGEHDKDFQQYQALDLKIAKALQIDVPELQMPELPDVDAPGATPLPQRKRSTKPVWFAIAASVVLATSISVRMSGVFESHESLADAVLAHIDHEPDALRVSDVAVSRRPAGARRSSVARGIRAWGFLDYLCSALCNKRQLGAAPCRPGEVRSNHDPVDAGRKACGSHAD